MGLYNEKDTKEIAAERSFEMIVYVKIQDEDSMTDTDQIADMYWAIESRNVLVMATYKFEVSFSYFELVCTLAKVSIDSMETFENGSI